MYTTSQIAELVSMQASEWSKQGPRGTLPIIDAVNREMKSGNVQSNEYIDPTTGFPPLLTTVSGTYQYDLPDNCRQLESVFFEGNGSSYERYGSTFFRGVSYIEVPVTARRRTNSSNATVTFADDPGDTSSKYYTKYWIEPTSITSLNVQHDIEPAYELLLIDGCVSRIQYLQYGEIAPWLQWIERMRLEYWGDMNHNPSNQSSITASRPC